MIQRVVSRIRSLEGRTIEEILLDLIEEQFREASLSEREIHHLQGILTNPSLLVSSIEEQLRECPLETDPQWWQSVPDLPRGVARRGEGSWARRAIQAPDTLRRLGDKCVFELGVAGHHDVDGQDLEELGCRAYGRASEILGVLAEDQKLRDFYESNRLDRVPIEDEVHFLHRCADRVSLYGQLLQEFVRAASDGSGEGGSDGDGCEEPGDPTAAVASPIRERVTLGHLREAEIPSDLPPARLAAMLGEEDGPEAAQYLSSLERWALFSSLDTEALRERLTRLVINQEPAIGRLCDDISLFGTGTQDPRKPISYFFIGPTGVGKNYLVEQLVEAFRVLWGIEVPYQEIEGPQYTYPSDINELKGAARGFIRSDEEGILTEFHKRASSSPVSVLLVDEVEKAHPQLRKFFLSIMDRGTVTDNRGQLLNFTNTLIFYTSNIGYSDMAGRAQPIGYGDEKAQETRIRDALEREVRKQLSPEFINRVQLAHFNYLGREDAERIFDLEFAKIVRRYRDRQGIDLETTQQAKEALLARGFDPDYGARNLAAVLNTVVNIGLSQKLRSDDDPSGHDVVDILSIIREMREGTQPMDLSRLTRMVRDRARARVSYRRVVVDFRDGKFRYEPR